MDDLDKTNEAPSTAAPEPKKVELRNSHWCVHPTHGLGMIGEVGAQVSFHRFYTKVGDTSATLDSKPVFVDVSSLRLCTPTELPPHLDYTAEQLKDFGYSPR
jgi:hypothetical protein